MHAFAVRNTEKRIQFLESSESAYSLRSWTYGGELQNADIFEKGLKDFYTCRRNVLGGGGPWKQDDIKKLRELLQGCLEKSHLTHQKYKDTISLKNVKCYKKN